MPQRRRYVFRSSIGGSNSAWRITEREHNELIRRRRKSAVIGLMGGTAGGALVGAGYGARLGLAPAGAVFGGIMGGIWGAGFLPYYSNDDMFFKLRNSKRKQIR